MKNKFYFSIYFLFLCVSILFPQSLDKKYFVYTDILNVRENPSLTSKKIGTLSFGDVVCIKEIQGSGNFINSVYDKWCRIETNQFSGWINYFYIMGLPCEIEFPYVKDVQNNNNTSTNVYDELPEMVCIKNIVEKDGKKYFQFEIINDSYYHKDYAYEKEVFPIISKIHPASYERALNSAKRKGFVVDILDTMIIQDNPSLRKYRFCEYIISELHKKYPKELYSVSAEKYIFSTKDLLLEYGIKVGMSVDDLLFILGQSIEKNSDELSYFGNNTRLPKKLIFKIQNNKISSIEFYDYK